MSVIIKGMKLPKNCLFCPIRKSWEEWYRELYFSCPLMSRSMKLREKDIVKGRLEDCPLKPLEEELEKIKAEIVLLQSKYKYDSETEYYKVGRCEAHEEDLDIIDKRIDELKGENNE